jgi:hypothetical protein
MIQLSKIAFDYVPFPIGVIANAFPEEKYNRLVETFPPLELFQHKPELGNKYSLSELNNADKYYDFIERTPEWKEIYNYIKSEGFLTSVLKTLKERNLKLGLDDCKIKQKKRGGFEKLVSRIEDVLTKKPYLSTRFEFSMINAQGGYLLPHTDSPSKIITLVISICKDGEWNPAYGGGTDINEPVDDRKYFNYLNEQLQFNEVTTLKTVEFEPNQCMLFIKTFNSLHSVSPIKGPSGVLRRTLTINIEMNNSQVGIY